MQADKMQRGRRPFLRRLMALGGLMALPGGVRAQQSETQAGPHPPASADFIFAGIHGSVVAFERATGNTIWSTHLSGADFVNVVLVGGGIYAATRGELFCIDPGTGQVRWYNQLKGYGRGLMTIATAEVSGNQAAVIRAKRRKEEAAASPNGGTVTNVPNLRRR